MLNKNSIYKLIKNVKTLISSDEFKTKHCLKQNAFTRNRKLSFQGYRGNRYWFPYCYSPDLLNSFIKSSLRFFNISV